MSAMLTIDTLNLVATSLPSLPAVSGFIQRVAGAGGLSGSPSENWMIIGTGVFLHWGAVKATWVCEMIGETRAVVEELRAGVKLAAVVGLKVLGEVKEGRRMGGGSFARFAAVQAVAHARGGVSGQGARAAYVMGGGIAPRVLVVSRPAGARKVAGKGIRRAG